MYYLSARPLHKIVSDIVAYPDRFRIGDSVAGAIELEYDGKFGDVFLIGTEGGMLPTRYAQNLNIGHVRDSARACG
jgi:hypothetical protein